MPAELPQYEPFTACGRVQTCDLTCLDENAISTMPTWLPRFMALCECTLTGTVLLDKRAPHMGESMGHVFAFHGTRMAANSYRNANVPCVPGIVHGQTNVLGCSPPKGTPGCLDVSYVISRIVAAAHAMLIGPGDS